jgi:hypothetical protein
MSLTELARTVKRSPAWNPFCNGSGYSAASGAPL